MESVYHVYINSLSRNVKYSNLNVDRIFLVTWLSELNMDYQVEFKLGIL